MKFAGQMKWLMLAPILVAAPAYADDITGVPRIVDGDTVEIGATKIRLQGIDAPETDQLCLDAKGDRWACGITARDELVKKVVDMQDYRHRQVWPVA